MGNCLSYRLKIVHEQDPEHDLNEDTNLPKNVTRFSYKSLQNATNNFRTKIKDNGFSSFYKGTLEDGSEVMVKVFETVNNNIDFNSLVKIMSGVKHKNVVELIGFCLEGNQKMLVHDFVGDYSWLELLFPASGVRTLVLPWHRRVSICHGIARAIEYLHYGISPRVVLCDVKPRNVLMDSSFNPKIVDFEVACLLEDDESHDSGNIRGTVGYIDPEFFRTGRCSEKVDVYAFGITMLEIISGRRNLKFVQDSVGISLVDEAWELRESGRIPDIVDSTLSEFSEDEVIRFVTAALSCVQLPSELRPSISELRLMLSDDYDFSNTVLIRPPRDYWQRSSPDELSDSPLNNEE
ncbi:hypothetical protein BVRB_3g058420 isoform B [Beta vulgaris subsp. vulgaris]|nr:hypothetical protein BVRB_3g058420 isoform B [Beta vulgaris subsp. vulgaris]